MSDPTAARQERTATRRWPRRLAGGLAAGIAAAALWLGYIGAFGGQLYFDMPAENPRPDVAALIFSGDLGFRIGMAPHVGQRLAAAGIPVIGVSSLVHFRTRRRPDEVRGFIEEAMRHARAVTGARRLVLIGQSYGADMLHIGLAALPPAERRGIALIALVVPTDTIYFRISPAEMFEWTAPDAEALPTARKLDWVPMLCVRGRDETASLCPMLHQPNVEQLALPGGHPLHRDSAVLAGALLGKIGRTLATARE